MCVSADKISVKFAVRRFHSLFHSLWSLHIVLFDPKTKRFDMRAMKGAFHRSLTVLVCYRFPLHVLNKHQYLALDVSLPPPNYLSCSPKQLDSGSTFSNYVNLFFIFNITRDILRVCVCVKNKKYHRTAENCA